jgi:hypothetical protein
LRETSERMLLTARWLRWEGEGDEKRIAMVHSNARADHLRHRALLAHHDGHAPVSEHGLIERTMDTSDRFRWHELHHGPELVVFGHDAKQGLFRKTLSNGRPICVGLDTGCTYGRSLTGYFPEFDDAVQVHSERTYFDLERNVIMLKQFGGKELFDRAL